MPIDIPRLRYWFGVAAISLVTLVAGFYLYARFGGGKIAAPVPSPMPAGVQQSTQGFSLSKSEGGRTLFTVRAESATQFQQGGKAELKGVTIVIYGHDSSRFDQIYGSSFSYDPQSGDVTAQGVVNIDLQGDSAGLAHPDQAPPLELKNPVHLTTSGLVFNQKTGNAETLETVEFRTPQASGSARGAHYDSRQQSLKLDRDVQLVLAGKDPANITARQGFISKEPRRTVLYGAHITREQSAIETAQLTMLLRPDDSIERMLASGGIDCLAGGPTTLHVRAPEAVLYLEGRSNDLRRAEFRGGTSFDARGVNTMFGSAEVMSMEFAANNQLGKVNAQGNVRLLQPPHPPGRPAAGRPPQPAPAGPSTQAQTLQLATDTIQFFVADGNQLESAETGRGAQIVLTPQTVPLPESGRPAPDPLSSGERTVISAAKFRAGFRDNHIDSLTGTEARVVAYTPQQADRISTSRILQVAFSPAGEVAQVVQREDFQYQEQLPDGTQRRAWAQQATYAVATDTLTLNGSPRFIEGGMTTTARVLRLQRRAGDAVAEGEVKTTYSDVKPQPGGALLAGGDPVHVTARHMTVQRATGVAHYSENARLWRAANIIEAFYIDFDRNSRTLTATGNGGGRVVTVLTQQDQQGKLTTLNIVSNRLTYAEEERRARFDGGIVARSTFGTLTASRATVDLTPARVKPAERSALATTQDSRLDKIVAEGGVLLQQPGRRASGERLTYTAAKDEYVMEGGPPSVVDAQRGTVTGAALTFYNHDDRVLVEGSDTSRAVTHTRVSK